MLIVSVIVFQLIIFAVLIVIFRQIMSKNVVDATKHLEELDQDFATRETDLTRQIEEVKAKAQDILSKAQEDADKEHAQVVKDAEAERDKLLKQARDQSEAMMQQADKSRQQLLGELDDRINREALKKSVDLMYAVLPEGLRRQIHARWVEDLFAAGLGHFKQAGASAEAKVAKVVTAFPLTDSERKKLAAGIAGALGRDVKVEEESDPKLVAGITVTIGNLVLDGTLKNKIRDEAKGDKGIF